MSILIDKSTRLIVQGITGRDGLFHAKKMKEYGTHVVGGTSPGKGGTDVDGIPVFNTMYDAVEQTKANTSEVPVSLYLIDYQLYMFYKIARVTNVQQKFEKLFPLYLTLL